MRGFLGKAIFVVLAVFIMMPLLGIEAARASESQQHVYDHAHLLSKRQHPVRDERRHVIQWKPGQFLVVENRERKR